MSVVLRSFKASKMPLGDLLLKANLENYDPSVAKDMPTYPGLMLSAHVLRENIQVGAGFSRQRRWFTTRRLCPYIGYFRVELL